MNNCTFHFIDNILISQYKENLNIDLDMAKEIIAERLAFQNGKDYPAIIYLNGAKPSSKRVRMFFGKEGIQGITMGAFIIKNPIEKVILSFFLAMEKPIIPSKCFSKIEDAVQWIHEHDIMVEAFT